MAQLAPGAMALGGAVANQQVTKWRFLNMEKHGKTWKNHGFHGISHVFIEICSRHSTISTSFNTPADLFFNIIIRHIGDVTTSWGYSS
jgi:hypothetical protein